MCVLKNIGCGIKCNILLAIAYVLKKPLTNRLLEDFYGMKYPTPLWTDFKYLGIFTTIKHSVVLPFAVNLNQMNPKSCLYDGILDASRLHYPKWEYFLCKTCTQTSSLCSCTLEECNVLEAAGKVHSDPQKKCKAIMFYD